MLLTTILSSRRGPLEITGGGVTIPKKNSCKENFPERKITEAVVPKKLINVEEMTYMALLALQGKG